MEPIALLITALVAAMSAFVAAFIAIRKFPAERRQAEASTAATLTGGMVELVEKQQERITELEGRQDTYEAAIEALQKRDREMQKQIRDLEGQNRWLVRENTVLRQSLHEHGIDVPEFRAQE